MDVKGKHALVVGLGSSGFSSALLLTQKGARVSVTDSTSSEAVMKRRDELAGKGVRVETGGHTESFCKGHDLVVLSPGVDRTLLSSLGYAGWGVPVIGELELGYLFCPAPIVAITGTNGKTTVTSLIGDIFALAGRQTTVCGNIGNPFTGETGGLTEKSWVVLEVSSFQLETINSFRPKIAILLNVTDDHYDRHGGFEAYKLQKFRIFSNQTEDDIALLNSDFAGDPAIKSIKSRIVYYGGRDARYRALQDRVVLCSGGREDVFIGADETRIKGRHNMENIACCAEAAELAGIDISVTREAIKNFRGLEHRFQMIGSSGGVIFIDDSKATNVDAAKRALESIDRRVVLIAGGRDKLGDYGVLSPLIRDKVSALVVIGEAKDNIKRAYSGIVDIHEAGGMEDAVEKAVRASRPGEAVMLSPMCSSFDMFDSYSHRGKVFREAVKKVTGLLWTGRDEK